MTDGNAISEHTIVNTVRIYEKIIKFTIVLIFRVRFAYAVQTFFRAIFGKKFHVFFEEVFYRQH